MVACNAILGHDDVRLRGSGQGIDDDGGDGIDPAEVDADTRPRIDRGALALGFLHTCARQPTNGVLCWGTNGAGQLGDGQDASTRPAKALKPVAVPGLSDVSEISAGLNHTCVVKKDGSVLCWGLNTFGQLGDGTTTSSSTPLPVKDLRPASSLGAGQSFTCAVMQDKTVQCWGANYSGQLGDGLKASRGAPAPVKDLVNVVSVSSATDHACAVIETGSVACWGGNATGQLGNGTTNESLTPVRITSLSSIVQVAAASRFTCARQQLGRVYCWGSNEFGQLGNGTTSTSANPSPNVVVTVNDAVFIWTGFEHACAVRKTGSVACWGKGDSGQIGNDSRLDASVPRPVTVVNLAGVRAAWTGGERSCALLDEGRAYCWGKNSEGQLGNGSDQTAYAPVPVSNFP
jgi:alpha-tubulin suppressor-like RCC1 family protein